MEKIRTLLRSKFYFSSIILAMTDAWNKKKLPSSKTCKRKIIYPLQSKHVDLFKNKHNKRICWNKIISDRCSNIFMWS